MANVVTEKLRMSIDDGCSQTTIIPLSTEEFTKNGFKALIEATRNSNSLPQDRDWDFYNTHQSFRNLMTDGGDKILHLINGILKDQGVQENIKNRDLEEKIELIVEANDTILERVAIHLDELSGIRKNPELPIEIQSVSAVLPVSGSWNKINDGKIIVSSSGSPNPVNISPNAIHLLTGKNIQRSQKFFKDHIDNSNKTPWEPRIKEKPNSLKPLAIFLEGSEDGLGEIFSHPYEFELDRFEANVDDLSYVKARKARSLLETPLHMVETPAALAALLEDLRKYKEISVDLEHHSYRTFLGFTCLMQISTGDTDYLIDTLALRDKLFILNEVFTNATIVKIFHGADNDIEWLQRDLSLYIVNMFDTYQAAKQLGYPHLSLAYLLKKFCHIDANKHFQLADWRMRPLPDELKLYARQDTHYLIYIYHMMRNALLERGNNKSHILKSVIQASTNVCKKRYKKPVLHPDSHLDLYRRCKKLFDNRQMYALKHLYKWRDETARIEDESTGYVLPNHMLLQIAELLPREMQGILACCNPIPPLVRANLLDLHKIVLKAREQSVVKAILSEESRSRGSTQNTFKTDTVLNCPHDLSRCEEFRDDLPTLLSGTIIRIEPAAKLIKSKATLSVFESADHFACELDRNSDNIRRKLQKLTFFGPYERYKLIKQYVRAEEEEKNAEEHEENEKEKATEITDKERIAALHEHFKSVTSSVEQVPRSAYNKDKHLPLSEMQDKKRKRKSSDDDGDDDDDVTLHVHENSLHTPIPSGAAVHLNESCEQNEKPKRKRNRRNKSNNRNNIIKQSANNRDTNLITNIQTPENNRGQEQGSKRNRKRKQANQGNCNKEQSGNNHQKQQQIMKKRKWNEDDNEDTFRPFDYSAVDFNRFGGGAGSANNPRDIRTNFKSRGSKNRKFDNIGRTNVKSGTFAGNRGRGNNRGAR